MYSSIKPSLPSSCPSLHEPSPSSCCCLLVMFFSCSLPSLALPFSLLPLCLPCIFPSRLSSFSLRAYCSFTGIIISSYIIAHVSTNQTSTPCPPAPLRSPRIVLYRSDPHQPTGHQMLTTLSPLIQRSRVLRGSDPDGDDGRRAGGGKEVCSCEIEGNLIL